MHPAEAGKSKGCWAPPGLFLHEPCRSWESAPRPSEEEEEEERGPWGPFPARAVTRNTGSHARCCQEDSARWTGHALCPTSALHTPSRISPGPEAQELTPGWLWILGSIDLASTQTCWCCNWSPTPTPPPPPWMTCSTARPVTAPLRHSPGPLQGPKGVPQCRLRSSPGFPQCCLGGALLQC